MLRCELCCMDSSQWVGRADAVLTNAYGPLPECVRGLPSVVTLFEGRENRRELAEKWCGAELTPVGRWQQRGKNTIYVAGLPYRKIPVERLTPTKDEMVSGWFPLDLPRRVLDVYSDLVPPGSTIWDGFCGRGTVGLACRNLGYGYVGVDKDPLRVEIARNFLGLVSCAS